MTYTITQTLNMKKDIGKNIDWIIDNKIRKDIMISLRKDVGDYTWTDIWENISFSIDFKIGSGILNRIDIKIILGLGENVNPAK